MINIDGKSFRTNKTLDPIPPEVLKDNLLLDRALKHLGLFREWRGWNWLVFDDAKHPYKRLRNWTDVGVWAINGLSEFLETKYFECYGFSFNYNILTNPFHNISKEELTLKLDILCPGESPRNDR